MKSDNLIDAFSNIDPSFITEAAYEVDRSHFDFAINKRRQKLKFRNTLMAVIPAAACVLIVIGVIGINSVMNPSFDSAPTAATTAASTDNAAVEEAETACAEESVSESEIDSASDVFEDSRSDKGSSTKSSASSAEKAAETEAQDTVIADEGYSESDYEENDINSGKTILDSVVIESASYEGGLLTLEIVNSKDDKVIYVSQYRIYKEIDGEYEEVPLNDTKDSPAISIDGNSSVELVIDLSEVFEPEEGNYKILLGDLEAEFTVK